MSLEKWSWFLVQVQNEERDWAASIGKKNAERDCINTQNLLLASMVHAKCMSKALWLRVLQHSSRTWRPHPCTRALRVMRYCFELLPDREE